MAVPLFEISISKSPIAIVKGGDRRLHFYKVKKFADKYFAIKDGLVFELDDRYEYRWKRTSIYIYNFSNSKPLLLSGMEEVDTKLKKVGESELFNKDQFLAQLEMMQQSGKQIDITKIDIPEDYAENLLPQTRRFLQDYASDDERSKTVQMIKVHRQKNPIAWYSKELSGIGMNRTDFAIIQIAHKKLDIVPMFVHENKAYTKYGVFEYLLDNAYYVKKQAIAFFVLNDDTDIVRPIPRPAEKIMTKLVRRKEWSALDTLEKPHKNKVKHYKPGKVMTFIPVDLTGREDVVLAEPEFDEPPEPETPDENDETSTDENPDEVPDEQDETKESSDDLRKQVVEMFGNNEPDEPTEFNDQPEQGEFDEEQTEDIINDEQEEPITEEPEPDYQVKIDDATPPPKMKGSGLIGF